MGSIGMTLVLCVMALRQQSNNFPIASMLLKVQNGSFLKCEGLEGEHLSRYLEGFVYMCVSGVLKPILQRVYMGYYRYMGSIAI